MGIDPGVQVLALRSRLARTEVVGHRPEPVTVTAARVVRPHRRQAFEEWAEDVLQVARTLPGNLGGTLLKPGPGSSEYHLVYRFRDDAALAAWERSPQRREALERMQEMVDGERVSRVSGLDSFFTRPAQPGPRWRTTLLTVLGVFAITLGFQLLVTPHVSSWPLPARLLLSACVVVLLLGYVVMPALTRLFRPWLRARR
ncbi:antibiotic biosynthesis monooxygenase [Blastococcus sp. TF02A-26]|uniref:antibiotic biosynthesis monooxygenase n=1 Tax=Blastococcus sp. TF02A-26 TaxID=2250577 RepID=UPI001F3C480A|nr:antibiotic biosynthesis monooxygenase [Blastococcus sp. TF02A-26]